MRNTFLEKSCTKYCVDTNPRPFSEKLKLKKCHTVCLYFMPS